MPLVPKRFLPSLLGAACLAGAVLLLWSQRSARGRKIESTTTETLDFAPGGSVEVKGSFGDVYIEGWGEPVARISVTKALPWERSPKGRVKALEKLDRVKVAVTKQGEKQLLIASTIPFRRSLDMRYRIRVPWQSRVVVEHNLGDVKILDVAGDIIVTDRIGDIAVRLPESETYQIDAQTRVGNVKSEFAGSTNRVFLIGDKIETGPVKNAHQIDLRVGIGGIQLYKLREGP
jgi:bifunctional DNA-binding transcriptional regulator/antitoxin component of YhaV-PrlF toxin-antitoxin module